MVSGQICMPRLRPAPALAGRVCMSALRAVGEPWVTSGGLLRCRGCRRRTSLTAGTIFEGTRKPLGMWFMAMWLVTSQKNGVSALGLHACWGSAATRPPGPGCTSCAGRWSAPDETRLGGTVEVDETYVGGSEKGGRGRETESKAIVAVAAEEDGKGIGRIRLRRDHRTCSADSLLPFIHRRRGAGGGGPHRRLERLLRG